MADNKPPTNANSKEDVYQFLKTIETYSQSTSNATPNASGPGGSVQAADTRAVFEFLDQFSQTKPTAATPPNSTGTGATIATGKKIEGNRTEAKSVQAQEQSQQQPSLDRQPSQKQTSLTETIGAGWAWNNLLATATTAYKTASTVVDSSVKGALATVETVRANETTKKFEERVREYVNKEAIEKIGTDLKTLSLSTLTTVVNVVAPPIAEHEVVEVWLTHDMIGYVGLESIVYHAFMRIMEQVEGGDILVRKGSEVKRRDAVDEGRKDLNVCEGFAEAVGIAKANIEQTIKHHFIPHPTSTFFPPDHPPLSPLSPGAPPVTTCPVFMAIQPTKASPMPSLDGENKYLYYTVVLNDPTHHLNFYTFSQSLPISWLEVPYADNEWVEEKMIEAIRLAVTCVAQDYVWHRMKDDHAAAEKKDEEVVVNEAKEGD